MAVTSPLNPLGHRAFENVDRVELSDRQRLAWESQIEQVRQDFLRQHRRLGTPLSQAEVRNPAISRVVDQIRILNRAIDSELLKYDTVDEPVLPPESLRQLLELNTRWADRLENQIWLLEDNLKHGQQLNRLLNRLFADGAKAFLAVDEFAHGFTDRVTQVPESSLLIPEPGLILADELSSSVEPGAAELIARALQTTRLLAWTQNRCRPLATDRRTAILFVLLRDAGLFAIDRRFRGSQTMSTLNHQSRQMAVDLVSRWRGVPSGLTELLTKTHNTGTVRSAFVTNVVDSITRLVDLMEVQSVELAKKNILADPKTAFGPAVGQLMAEARIGRFDEQQVRTLLTTLNLSEPELIAGGLTHSGFTEPIKTRQTGLAERLLLFKRLRRHSSHQPQGDTGDKTPAVPRPQFLRNRAGARSRTSVDSPHRHQ